MSNNGVMVIEDGTGTEYSHKLVAMGIDRIAGFPDTVVQALDDTSYFCEDEGYKVTCRDDIPDLHPSTLLIVYSANANTSRVIAREIKNLFFNGVF